MVFARLACHRLVANGSRWTLGESTWSDRSSRSDQKTATEQPEARQKKNKRPREPVVRTFWNRRTRRVMSVQPRATGGPRRGDSPLR
jgi:hypothetical protein